MFDADRPIISSTQDKLNRTLFAKYLARCMLDHKDPDSLVIGLYGGWGAGKTSIINLIVEELNASSSNTLDDEKPIILNFSPWSYSGQDQLIYNFFRRLSSTLKEATYLDNAETIIELLELYVSYFTHKSVSLNGQKEKIAWDSGRDLTKIKAELNGLLRLQKHKIIIIIDNISRLYNTEVQQIFQIVKSIGDFSNTSYLLAIDKELVVDKLDRLDPNSGEQFIEKVVQLPFDVPPIFQQDLELIFAAKMEDIVETIPEDAWNKEYWADVYYTTLRYLFQDCRDITRYINTLNFSYMRLRNVVNPVDFFALTAIEVFAPEVYFGIRDNKDLFTDLFDNVYESNSDHADELRCEEILSRSNRIPRDTMLELLCLLFPRIRKVYHPDINMYHSAATARKLRRICSPDLFDAYFRLSIQSGNIQLSEFDAILALARDKTAFEQALTRLNQDDRILKFLDQLDGNILHTIPESYFPAIIGALIENGDLFPHGTSGYLHLNTPMRIHRIIHGMLDRIDNPKDRYLLLKNAIDHSSKSLYVTIHELNQQGNEHIEESDTYIPEDFRDVTPAQLELLKKAVVKKIKVWAENGSLEDHPQLLPILNAWLSWGDPQECREYIFKLTDTDRGLVIFLTQILNQPILQAMVEYRKDPAWTVYLDDMEDFIPALSLEPRATAIFKNEYFEKLRETEQLAVMIYLDLINSTANKIIPNTSD